MKHIMKLLVLFLAATLMTSPVIAKSDSESGSKAKKSESTKSKKTKKEKNNKKEKSSKKESISKKKSKTKKEEPKKTKTDSDSNSDSKKSTSKKSSGKKDEDESSSSNEKTSSKKSSSSRKSSTRPTLANSNKAKQFKNITVNINKADSKTLQHYLVGIGEKRATDIIKYRKKNGKFKSIDDLKEVTGLGEGIFAGIKKNISLTSGETNAPKSTKSTKK